MSIRLLQPLFLIAVLVVVGWPRIAGASDILYFSAIVAPEASLVASDGPTPTVHLRWDTLEAPLPADIVGFVLRRDGQEIARLPAQGIMSEAEINALYRGAAQRRRLLETVSGLKRQALADPGFDDFPLNAFAQPLRARLLNPQDPLWPIFAARTDINIARARYRAWLDQPGPGIYQYELLATDAQGAEARVGLVDVDAAQPTRPLPATDFRQVEQGACDSPDAGKDDYTVALSWRAPRGDGEADRLAATIYTAGYDLYRTTVPFPEGQLSVPARDLAAEALSASYDDQGRMRFAGLEKVNEVLLTLDGAEDGEPVFIETQNELALAGLQPGDVRVYYLVARDFAGQFGATQAARVRVPDRSRPPMPWDVRVYNDLAATPPRAELIWDFGDRDGYLAAVGSGLTVCNAQDRSSARYLSVVNRGQSCAEDVQRRIRIPADDYLVYRFENNDLARSFKDSDGDGVGDADERSGGTECITSLAPGSAPNRLVQTGMGGASLTVRNLPNGDNVVVFEDQVPASAQGDVYWYRIAARTADGRLSPLTPPVRLLFPQRDLPAPPTGQIMVDTEDCTRCEAVTVNADARWGLTSQLGAGDAGLVLQCAPTRPPLVFTGRLSDYSDPDSPACQQVAAACAGTPVSLGYIRDPLQNAGVAACATEIPASAAFCAQGRVSLEARGCERVTYTPGMPTGHEAEVTLTPEDPTQCVILTESIAGQDVEIASTCGRELGGGALTAVLPRLPFCGRGYAKDADGNVSPPIHLGCIGEQVGDADSRPTPPQPVAFDMGETEAVVRWRLPPEPVAVTMIELQRQGDDGLVRLTSAPRQPGPAGESVPLQRFELSVADIPVLGGDERWCARFRIVPPATAGRPAPQSDWSPPICDTRDETLPPPDWLPWPVVPASRQGAPVLVQLGSELADRRSPDSGLPMIPLGAFDFAFKDCAGDAGGQTASSALPPLYLAPRCVPRAEQSLLAAVSEWLPLLVYRQSEAPDGSVGEWVQVAPRLDIVHWADNIELIDRQDGEGPVRSPLTLRLADPWIRLYRQPEVGPDRAAAAFVDRYPVLPGYRYRYQLVRLTPDNRISGWQQTNWVEIAGAEVTP